MLKRKFTFHNPWFRALKSALAAGLALVLCRALHIPDLVSSAFIAVLCTSPTVSLGFRTGLSQLGASMLGATVGVAIGAFTAPSLGVPIGIGLAVLLALLAGFPTAVPVAAFSALFVQLVPFGDGLETWLIRQEAIVVAALAALAVNIVISALFYKRLFTRRQARLAAYFDANQVYASKTEGPILEAFGLLESLRRELLAAQRELHVRNSGTESELGRVLEWVEATTRTLHFQLSTLYAAADEGH